MTTFVGVLVLGASALLSVLFAAWLLRLGAGWAKIPNVTYKRSVVAVLLMNVAVVAIELGALAYLRRDTWASLLVQLGLELIASWKVTQWTLRTTIGRAILAWLPTLLAGAVALVFVLCVMRPFLFEGFYVPTNAMAPTVVGQHYRGDCPLCGGVSIVAASQRQAPVPDEDLGICQDCLRAAKAPVRDKTRFPGDRVLVAKFLHPQRWDLIVFRYPADPSVNYLMRLVGLPGEEVAIRDGEVWINGAPAQTPDDLSGLVYSADPDKADRAVWGPVRLGIDECFVLGDFSLRSADSRLWRQGAPKHAPYAVPESYIVGVVTEIFWPPSRWRVLR